MAPLRVARQGLGSAFPAILVLFVAAGCRDDGRPERLRTLEARLSAEVVYSPWELRRPATPRPSEGQVGPVLRSGSMPPARNQGDVIAALATALEAGLDVETLRRAVTALEAEGSSLGRARRLTALAAVQHALAKLTVEPRPLLDAYGSAAAAVSAGGGLAALFDQALIAGDLGLCRYAEELWGRYLSLDPKSSWASEARRHLAELSCRQRTEVGPDERFLEAMETLVPQWLEARSTDSAAAAALLARIEEAGERLAADSGEGGLRALAAELRALRREVHAVAIADYVVGRRAFDELRWEEAGARLLRALPALEAARSELVPWCRLWLAGIEISEGRFDRAIGTLDALLAATPADRRYLVGRLHWAAGLAGRRQGSFVAAHDRLAAAEAVFAEGGYRSARASVATLRSDTLGRQGLDLEGWRLRIDAIRVLQTSDPPYYLHNALVVGGTVASEHDEFDLSQAFLREAELLAVEKRNAVQEAEASIWQARALCRTQPEAALEIYRTALRRIAASDLSPDARPGLEASAVVGFAACAGDPTLQDEARLVDAIDFFRVHGPEDMQLRGLRAQASLLVSRGDRTRARVILAAAIDLIHATEERLSKGGKGSFADSYREVCQGTYDEAIALALDEGRDRDALALLEDSRGLAPGPSPQASLDRLLARGVPGGKALVVDFGLIDDRLAWWRIDGEELRSGVVPANRTLQIAQDLIRDLQAGRSPRSGETFSELYEALLSGPLAGVEANRPLVLIPDGALQQVPFAALRNPKTGVRLIDERAISLRVSLEQAMSAADTSTRRARKDWRVAIAGDPAFDESALPLLPRLPGASDEAKAVERVYGAQRAVTLLGRSATPPALAQASRNVEVLHLAAHVLPGSEPASDVFVLAASDGGSGLAGPDAMLAATTSLRLAVLSACSSAGRRPSRTDGLLGLARGFSARGVAATLGTLWPIADRSLEALMIDFHGGIRGGLAASEALRQAQMRMRRSGDEAAELDWAALALFGDFPAEE